VGKFTPLNIPSWRSGREYPFILTTGRVLEHWHGGSMTRNSALNEAYPEARLEMNPADAVMHGITDGMAVRVTSRRGEVVLRATVTEKTTVGVLFIPMHFDCRQPADQRCADPQAKIPVQSLRRQVFPAQDDSSHPEAVLHRGPYWKLPGIDSSYFGWNLQNQLPPFPMPCGSSIGRSSAAALSR
jgi:anaerobic selenocysteine-containing dehydrogenase